MNPEIFYTLPHSDLRLYYNNTFVRMRPTTHSKPWNWIWIEDFGTSGETSNVLVAFRDAEIAIKTVLIKDYEWDFTLPAAGAYNYHNSVVVISRNPVRSTVKGVAKQNTNFCDLLYEVAAAGGIPRNFYAAHAFSLSAPNLNCLFEEMEPLPFARGLEKLMRKQLLAFTVNNRISISQGIFSKHPSLWLKNRLVGEFNVGKEIIYPLHMAFVPELANAVAEYGITVKQT